MEETLLLDLIQREPTGAPIVMVASEAERIRIATCLLSRLAQMPTQSAASIPLREVDCDDLAAAAERLSKSSIYFVQPENSCEKRPLKVWVRKSDAEFHLDLLI